MNFLIFYLKFLKFFSVKHQALRFKEGRYPCLFLKEKRTLRFTLHALPLQAGFTLVELLAVMMVFGIVSGIAGSILVTSLRTSQKANVTSQIRDNGNFAISQMVKTIQNARSLVDPFPCVVAPSTQPTPVKSITFTDQYGTQLQFTCNDSSDTDPNYVASNGASLLNTNVVSIKQDSCNFTCSQKDKSDYPTIGISFTLQQAGSPTVQERTGSIPFSTSVVFRNFNR